jgi:hypothetical protein
MERSPAQSDLPSDKFVEDNSEFEYAKETYPENIKKNRYLKPGAVEDICVTNWHEGFAFRDFIGLSRNIVGLKVPKEVAAKGYIFRNVTQCRPVEVY